MENTYYYSRYHHPLYYWRKGKGTVALIVGIGLAFLAVAGAGCSRRQDTASSADSMTRYSDSIIAATHAAGTAQPATNSATPTVRPMTDANILAELSESDSAEIVEAKLVLARTKNKDVREFANMMIADHSRLKNAGAELAVRLNVTPQPPANDPVPGELTQTLAMLRAAQGSAALDSIYVAHAVEDHRSDLQDVKDFETKTTTLDLISELKKAETTVQSHLDHAQMLEYMLQHGKPMGESTPQR